MRRGATVSAALVTLAAAVLLAAGCGTESVTRPEPAPPSALYVLNGLGETLSRVDLETGRVENDLLHLGDAPNALLFDPAGDRLFVANSGDNVVWSLQPDSLDRNGDYPLGPNTNPYGLAVTRSGELAVSGFLSGDVAFFSAATGALLRRVPVGRTPQAVLDLPGRTLVSVVHYDFPSNSFGPGEVVAIPDGAAAAGTRAIVGVNPQHLVTGPDGLLHVICTGNYVDVPGSVYFLNAVTLAVVDSLTLGGTPAAAVVVGDDVYVSAYFGGLMKYDGRTHTVLRGPSDPVLDVTGLGGLAHDATTGRLYVSAFEDDLVLVVDVAADTLAAAWPVGDGPLDVELVTRP